MRLSLDDMSEGKGIEISELEGHKFSIRVSQFTRKT